MKIDTRNVYEITDKEFRKFALFMILISYLISAGLFFMILQIYLK